MDKKLALPFTAETQRPHEKQRETPDRINKICRINKLKGQTAAHPAKFFRNPVNPVNPVHVFLLVSMLNGYDFCRGFA
jgi:hypothetical protein